MALASGVTDKGRMFYEMYEKRFGRKQVEVNPNKITFEDWKKTYKDKLESDEVTPMELIELAFECGFAAGFDDAAFTNKKYRDLIREQMRREQEDEE